jgi:hypothetical protein
MHAVCAILKDFNTIIFLQNQVEFHDVIVQRDEVWGTGRDFRYTSCPPNKIAFTPNTSVTFDIMRRVAAKFTFDQCGPPSPSSAGYLTAIR